MDMEVMTGQKTTEAELVHPLKVFFGGLKPLGTNGLNLTVDFGLS